MKLQITILGFLLMLIFSACKKDSDNKPEDNTPDFLFKAYFINDWLLPQSGEAVIFISDELGNVLSEQIWAGNDTIEMLPIDSALEYPETINITTVYYNPDYNRFYLTTNLGIPVASEWTFKGTKPADPNSLNTVNFVFQNVPEHKSYIMSSMLNSKANESAMSQPFSYNFYESPADIYLKLNTVDHGYRYKWFHNVVNGSRNEDLSISNLSEAQLHTINFDGTSSGIRMSLFAYPEPGNHYSGSFRVDALNDYTNTYKLITFSYPGTDFTDYRTMINFYDDFTASNYWTQLTFGSLPNDFSKINADFDIINSSINNFELSATGDFTHSKSVWIDSKSNNWTVYGDKTYSTYKLPILSQLVIEKFKIDRALFKLEMVELIDYPELESYDEVLEIIFNSPNHFFDVVNRHKSRTKLSIDSENK